MKSVHAIRVISKIPTHEAELLSMDGIEKDRRTKLFQIEHPLFKKIEIYASTGTIVFESVNDIKLVDRWARKNLSKTGYEMFKRNMWVTSLGIHKPYSSERVSVSIPFEGKIKNQTIHFKVTAILKSERKYVDLHIYPTGDIKLKPIKKKVKINGSSGVRILFDTPRIGGKKKSRLTFQEVVRKVLNSYNDFLAISDLAFLLNIEQKNAYYWAKKLAKAKIIHRISKYPLIFSICTKRVKPLTTKFL